MGLLPTMLNVCFARDYGQITTKTMDLKKRIEEITQNGTLESGEQITYVDTDDLYLLLNEVNSSEVIHLVSDWNDWVYGSPTSIIDGSHIEVMWSDNSVTKVFYEWRSKSMAHKLPPIKWRYSNS